MPLFSQPTIFSRSACLSGRTGRAAHRGFTLIEVLVALTIISIALMASLRAVGSITAISADLRARTLAFQAAEAALREKAEHETTVASTRTHAADDDSASIDDENIEHSQTIGLAAVLEILGGRVIEEKMTEGGY